LDFTFEGYKNLLNTITESGYRYSDFHNFSKEEKICILRHDIDLSLDSALKMAEIENEMSVSSTYYVLLNTQFYNLMHTPSRNKIKKISALGHKIGLHFDAKRYEGIGEKALSEALKDEIDMLSDLLDCKVDSFSIHRPTKQEIENNICIDGIVNTYSPMFFKNFKYISDSRMRWRENPEEVITGGKHLQIQVLTHPIWYNEKNCDMASVLRQFLETKNKEIYNSLSENITDLNSVL